MNRTSIGWARQQTPRRGARPAPHRLGRRPGRPGGDVAAPPGPAAPGRHPRAGRRGRAGPRATRYRWAVHRWIPGDGAALDRIDDPVTVRPRPRRGGPAAPGPSRRRGAGGAQPGAAAARLRRAPRAQPSIAPRDLIDAAAATAVWEEALAATPHDGPPVWVHGDLEGNCLVRDGRLCGLVDWGSACAGDPAVDVQVVWSPLFTEASRPLPRRPRGRRRHARPQPGSGDQPGLRRPAVLPAHLSADRRAVLAQAGRPRRRAPSRHLTSGPAGPFERKCA